MIGGLSFRSVAAFESNGRSGSAADFFDDLSGANPYIVLNMAKDTGKGFRKGAVKGRTQVKNPVTADWTKRNETPGSKKKGEFMDVKSGGKKFKGVAQEPDRRHAK